MRTCWLGRLGYEQAMALQRDLVAAHSGDAADDVLLLLEHEPVYTAGRHADTARNVLGTSSIPVVATDRGGDVTYHGPGQLVAYPILALQDRKGIRPYVEALLAACVRTAAAYGIAARADGHRTGVWVGGDKLVSVGVRVHRGITSHGVAFNVSPDLGDFAGIVPCGIRDAGVCSLASLGVTGVTVREAAVVLATHLASVLRRTLAWADREGIIDVDTAGGAAP